VEKNSSDSDTGGKGVRPYALRRFDETPAEKVVVSQSESAEMRLKRRENEATERGYQDGFAKGEADANARVEAVVERLTAVLREIENFAGREAEKIAPELLLLSIDIAEKIIHKTLELDREIVLAVTKDALQKVADTYEEVVVRINPADYEILNERVRRLKEESGLKGITLEPNESISPGGCYIEASSGSVDARIEEQMKEAANAVRTALNS